MRRGDLVTVAMQGDFGKPRPALVIQADRFADNSTLTVLLMTSSMVDIPLIRITVEPNERNSLQRPSQIMIDKTMSPRREKLGPVFGRVDDETMIEVTRRLALFLGMA